MTPKAACEWLITLNPGSNARLRLICFPYAGGGPQTFIEWPGLLPPDTEVTAVSLPGRGRRLREPAFTSLVPLAQALAPAIASTANLPFAFFGHSMGALLAYETALELFHCYGLMPVHLFVSGALPPHIPEPNPLHGLSQAGFVEELRKLGGMPEDVIANAELMELLLPALRADFRVAETYIRSPEFPLFCPITAFGGNSDSRASPARVEEWSRHTTGAFNLKVFGGGHFFLNEVLPAMLSLIAGELSKRTIEPHNRRSTLLQSGNNKRVEKRP